MRAVASSDKSTLNKLAWAVFWRLALGYAVATNLLLGGSNFVYASIAMFQSRASGLTNEQASALIEPGVLPWWLNILTSLAMLLVSFLILRWVLRALNGKNIGGKTFLLATVSNDKDS
jgi:hypothetical protein